MGVLEILGIVFLCVLLVAGYFGFKLYRGYKKQISGIDEFMRVQQVLPPIRMELFETNSPQWKHSDRLDADTRVLEASGFELNGVYETTMGKADALISLWANPKKGLMAALYEATARDDDGNALDDLCTYVADLCVMFTDNSTLTVSNNTQFNALPRPDEHKMITVESLSIKDLFAHIKPNLPEGKKVKPVGNVLTAFKDFACQYNGWLWEEQQLRSTKIEGVLEMLNIQVTDDLIEQLLEYAQAEKTEIVTENVLQKVAESAKMSAAKWESLRERMVVVHKKMTPQELASCFYELIDDVHDSDEQSIDALSDRTALDCPITTFDELLKQLNSGARVKRVATLQKPVQASVYVASPA